MVKNLLLGSRTLDHQNVVKPKENGSKKAGNPQNRDRTKSEKIK
jgi:hypothetical protein